MDIKKVLQKIDLKKLTIKDVQDIKAALSAFDFRSSNLNWEQKGAVEIITNIINKLEKK